MINKLLLACAWITLAIGAVGVVIPILPTTPFLMLSAFLFAKSSPRCHAWLCRTRLYKAYVIPFQEQGGIPLGRKAFILALSYSVMGVSAYFVQKPTVWIILGACALFLLWLLAVRIPTVPAERVESARFAQPAKLEAEQE